jgi:L-aspartate semialdehyde sulfurtransferase ferredoxin
MNATSKRVVLHFPRELVGRSIVCRLVKEHDLDFNILRANVTPREEGLMVIELSGSPDDLDSGISFLEKTGVKTQPLTPDVKRDDERCTQCGACVVMCPSGALLKEEDGAVVFDGGSCIACELCVKSCPPRAIEVHFHGLDEKIMPHG